MTISLHTPGHDEAKATAPHVDADGAPLTQSYPPYAGEPGGRDESVTVSVSDRDAPLRTYTFSSTLEQRDNAAKSRVFSEDANGPIVRSGSLGFDGLFAMAVDDARLNSASEIRDSSYSHGQPIACECFQTGEKWRYVWTRDLAYAADLGLAWFDPARVVNSLLFKTAGWRSGVAAPATLPAGSRQIVQDTGSGGSWPVSTDRVSWAWAAERVLNCLPDAQRASFAEQAYAALRGTVEADRQAAYDAHSGLYGGEQSFLDWRAQTYAPWITDNLSRMAASKSLSTNVAHHQALRLLAQLATERGKQALADRYTAWATQLRSAIDATFWLDDVQQYASLTSSGEDPVAVYKFDMLGTALVVLSGIASDERAREAIARYPHAPFGVPVYYPQQPDVPVYHNRAIWPFVTAYALRAAVHVKNPLVAANAIDSLMRGAALNLSNMENLEWLTGKPWYDDGPVINSRRQLWSVAAYLCMVTECVFGYHVEVTGIRIDPFLTTNARRALGCDDEARLYKLCYKGRPLQIVLKLPASCEHDGYHEVDSVSLNGQAIQGLIAAEQLSDSDNVIEVRFGAVRPGDARITPVALVDSTSRSDPRVYSPAAPRLESLARDGAVLSLAWSDSANDSVGQARSYNVYRDGLLVQAGLSNLTWTDAPSGRHCYAVEAVFQDSGHRSHHSESVCTEADAVLTIAVDDARVQSNQAVSAAGEGIAEPSLRDWGQPGDTFTVTHVDVLRDGRYGIELRYNNHRGNIKTGVTNCVKQVRVIDVRGAEVACGVLQMPHVDPHEGQHPIRTSTVLQVELAAGRYRLALGDYFNMSYLDSNADYTRGAGGQDGPVNDASIAGLRIFAWPVRVFP